jgi:hypothetical protein
VSSSAATAPATLERRAGAFAIDLGVGAAVPLMFVSMATGATFGASAMTGAAVNWPAYLTWPLLVVSAVGWTLVYTAMQGGGGSIGERVTGLRPADAATSARIGFGRALARNVVFVLTAACVVGFFTPLFDRTPRRQGWHDLAARADVVDVRAGAAVALAAGASALATDSASAYRADVSGDPVEDTTITAHAPTVVVQRVADPQLALAGPRSGARPAARALAAVDLDAMAASAPVIDAAAPSPAGHVPLVVLTWDDGSRMAVYERTVCGRNPQREPGTVALALRDETLSMSKTHFEIGGDAHGPWIVDRFSTNGTSLVRDGERTGLMPGLPASLRPGDCLEFGDRSAMVGGVA